MLQTCNRCRTRRIKCDSSLPACGNCAKNDLECTFRDDALREEVPRSYVKSLYDRINDLQSQLALQKSSNHGDQVLVDSTASLTEPSFNVTIPGSGQYMYLGPSLPSVITWATCEVLSISDQAPEYTNPDDGGLNFEDHSKFERSIVSPGTVRFLLGRFDRCIRPSYPVHLHGLSSEDETPLKKLPDSQKFDILIQCAIAAANESYRSPSYIAIARICREWAQEMITPIVSARDGRALSAILMLLLYELTDPGKGMLWDLLDTAIRTYLQLGWHRGSALSDNELLTNSHESPIGFDDNTTEKAKLVNMLKSIEGSLRMIFNRPNMLSGSNSPITSSEETFLHTYFRINQELYGSGGAYENQSCPFIGILPTLMTSLEESPPNNLIVLETWLLFLPICIKHKQCVFCFQEPDETHSNGMRSLRRRVVGAASDLLLSVHSKLTSSDNYIPPLMASTKAFNSGCTLVVAISKKWTGASEHISGLLKCSEILSFFAPHWRGGQNYLAVWRTIAGKLGK